MKPPPCSRLTLLLFPLISFSQSSDDIQLLQKLDSVRNSSVIASHFAGIYFNTTSRAISFFEHYKEPAKKFIQRLEARFAAFFFRAAEAYGRSEPVPREWKTYFADSVRLPIQYQLLGINAHINGDIWQALTVEFSLQELQENRKSYFQFNKELIAEYRKFYEASIQTSSKTMFLHNFTLGLARFYGKSMLVKWRKRQMQLAILFFTNRARFDKELGKVHQKMDQIDSMILHNL